jgi:hypothetical protein
MELLTYCDMEIIEVGTMLDNANAAGDMLVSC